MKHTPERSEYLDGQRKFVQNILRIGNKEDLEILDKAERDPELDPEVRDIILKTRAEDIRMRKKEPGFQVNNTYDIIKVANWEIEEKEDLPITARKQDQDGDLNRDERWL